MPPGLGTRTGQEGHLLASDKAGKKGLPLHIFPGSDCLSLPFPQNLRVCGFFSGDTRVLQPSCSAVPHAASRPGLQAGATPGQEVRTMICLSKLEG